MKGIVSRNPARIGLAFAMLVAFGLPGVPARAADYRLGDLEILHPWSRPTPQNAQVAAGYLTIRNTGTVPDRLVATASELSASGEINEMIADEQGVRRKRALGEGVVINPGNRVTFSPGELHLLFVRLQKPAVAGETFKGWLTFEKAGRIEVEFMVEPGETEAVQEIESSGDAAPESGGGTLSKSAPDAGAVPNGSDGS